MGNSATNHKKWFSEKKRKVLLLGLEKSGKTTFFKSLKGAKFEDTYTATKDLEIDNLKTETLDLIVFDPAGGERQRVFWRHHYTGTQGIIFFIDISADQDEQALAVKELNKIIAEPELQNAPILVFLNKSDLAKSTSKEEIVESLGIKPTDSKRVMIELGSLKNQTGIKDGIKWLSKTMVAI